MQMKTKYFTFASENNNGNSEGLRSYDFSCRLLFQGKTDESGICIVQIFRLVHSCINENTA